MVLESTVVCVDNSEYMRNGDFAPTRMESQRDAANLIFGTKLRDNPENSVALLSMGEKIDVLSTLTTDKGKLLHSLHAIKTAGLCNFVSGIMVAQLILRHRETKNHRQRVVVFAGSPILAAQSELVSLGKKLKKSSVNVDVISFGEEDENQEKLEAFINAVNKEDESHLVVIPSGTGSLSDSIMASPMLGSSNANNGGMGNMDAFGMDMESDPELAMALRLSLEEERQRQQRSQQEEAAQETQDTDQQSVPVEQQEGEQQQQQQQQESEVPPETTASVGDDALADALLNAYPSRTSTEATVAQTPATDTPNFDAMTEEQMLAYAISMSMQDSNPPPSTDEPAQSNQGQGQGQEQQRQQDGSDEHQQPPSEPQKPVTDSVADAAEDVFDDPDFLAGVLDTLPGVSKDEIPQMLATLHGVDQGEGNDDDGDGDDNKKKKKKSENTHDVDEADIDDVDD